MSDYYTNSREERRRKRRRKVMIRRAIFAVVVLALLGGIVFACVKLFGGSDSPQETQAVFTETETGSGEETQQSQTGENESETAAPAQSDDVQKVLDQAAVLAASYDYDGAIDALKAVPGYETVEAVTSRITDYEAKRDACVAVNPETVPHIFFHSLIVDTKRCFDTSKWGKSSVDGYNAWMCTIDEYKAVLQQLYDNGYVYVMLSDLYTETTDSSGNVTFAPNHGIMLPEGKKAIVVSFDDLAYYAQYYGRGFADKIVIDENGLLKCQYTDAAGNVSVGDYDWLPIFDNFVREHPDASYKGAKGTIALTGYDGVFGYRTDIGFFDNPTSEEAAWLAKFPDTDINEETEQAKVIAQAIKEDGYEFASHSWGHKSMRDKGLDWLQTDTGKWLERVKPIIGETDILIYPHGNDIAGLEDYSTNNEKYAYLKSVGFHVFCNVDAGGLYWNQFRSDYVRQARINIDGYTLYTEMEKGNTVIGQLGIDPSAIFDSSRPTPVIANGV